MKLGVWLCTFLGKREPSFVAKNTSKSSDLREVVEEKEIARCIAQNIRSANGNKNGLFSVGTKQLHEPHDLQRYAVANVEPATTRCWGCWKTPSDDNICRTCHTESYLYEVWTDSAAKFRLPGVDGGETPCGKEYKDNKNQEVPGSKGQTLCWYFEWIVSLSRKRYSMYAL